MNINEIDIEPHHPKMSLKTQVYLTVSGFYSLHAG